MKQYLIICISFLVIVIVGMAMALYHNGKVQRCEKDTIRDTIIIYKVIDSDEWEDDEEADWY